MMGHCLKNPYSCRCEHHQNLMKEHIENRMAELREQTAKAEVIAVSELLAAQKRIEKLQTVLGWYANLDNWDKETGAAVDMQPRGLNRQLWKVLDFGDRARAVLDIENSPERR